MQKKFKMPEKNTDRVLDLIIDKLEKLDESQAKLSEEIQKTNLELSKISGIKYALGDIKKNVEERDQIVNIDDLKKIKDFYLKHQDINSDVEDLYLITGELRNITDDYKKFKTKAMTIIAVLATAFSVATTIIGWMIK